MSNRMPTLVLTQSMMGSEVWLRGRLESFNSFAGVIDSQVFFFTALRTQVKDANIDLLWWQNVADFKPSLTFWVFVLSLLVSSLGSARWPLFNLKSTFIFWTKHYFFFSRAKSSFVLLVKCILFLYSVKPRYFFLTSIGALGLWYCTIIPLKTDLLKHMF